MYKLHLSQKQLDTIEKALDFYVDLSLGYVTKLPQLLNHLNEDAKQSLTNLMENFEFGTLANDSVVRDYQGDTVSETVQIANDLVNVIDQFKCGERGIDVDTVQQTSPENLAVVTKTGVRI